MQDFSRFIREVPDFPKPGIVYRDITPLLGNPTAFHRAIDEFALRYNLKQLMSLQARKHAASFSVLHWLIDSVSVLSRSEKGVNYRIVHTKPLMILNTVMMSLQFIKMHSRNTAKYSYVMMSWQLEAHLLHQSNSLRNWKGTSLALLF